MSASCDLVRGFAEGLAPIGGRSTCLCTGGAGPLPHDPRARRPQKHLPDVRAVGEPLFGRQPARPPPGRVHEPDGRGGKKRAGP